MNDRTIDNQANSLSPEQLRQLQGLFNLNNNLGLLGTNLNLLNPMALQNLLSPAANPNPVIGILQQQLQQLVHQSQRQQQQQQQPSTQSPQQRQQQRQPQQRQSQPQPPSNSSHSVESALLNSIRQSQPTIQNTLHTGLNLPPNANSQQRRRRGRPPLSGTPGTSSISVPATLPTPGPASVGSSSGVGYNYLNMLATVKQQGQQERDRLQREFKIQQERQREMRQQQEREKQREFRMAQARADREREIRLQQERERQRADLERQRKAQHRLALQDIDRERRRQHMIMVRNLDAYKKNVEREKTMNAMMVEREKQIERRMYQKRLEVELIKEIRKPVDDMMLKNHKPLATLNRIPGLKLPGKAFADLLMSYEFLYNFGETVGLELKQIPDINTLQLGLLNLNTHAENQFISVLHHLCVFAVKDQRFPYNGPTKEIENLERTNEGLSQLLHFYLQVVTMNSKTDLEQEFRLFKLIESRYFLSLNATQKAEMLAFICNELLCSQTVTKQMEDNFETISKVRKDKWVLENELRKYRVIKTKREQKEEAEQRAKEAALAASQMNGDSEKSDGDKLNESKDQLKSDIKREDDERNAKLNLTNGSSNAADNKRDNETTDTSIQPNNNTDLDDLEPEMTNDELNKKIENLTRQYNKTSNKLDRAINSMRVSPLGQDRFRRRYWVLPQVGGVFVEGMESSEPEELENNKFTEDELMEYEKEQKLLDEEANNAESNEQQDADKMEIKTDKDEVVDIGDKEDMTDVKEEDEPMDIKEDEAQDQADMKSDQVKLETVENGEPHNDTKLNSEVACDEASQSQVSNMAWFSILPRNSCDFSVEAAENFQPLEMDNQKKVREEENPAEQVKGELTSEELKAMRHDICPVLAKKLEELEAEQHETPKKIHPQFQCGWWRITDAQQLKAILSVLHERGTRERLLHKHLTKHFQHACNSCKNTTVDFEITSYDRQLAGKNYGAPMAHTDEDSADDLKSGDEDEEEEEEVEELDEETGDDKAIQQAALAATKKTKRKKASRSARSRRLRARAAARKKVENLRNKLAQR